MDPPSPPAIHRSNRRSPGSPVANIDIPPTTASAAIATAAVDAAISASSVSHSMDDCTNEEGPNSTFETYDTVEEEDDGDPDTTYKERDDDDEASTDHYDSGDEDDLGSHTDGSDYTHSDEDDDDAYDTLDDASHTDLGSHGSQDGSLFSDDEGDDTFDEEGAGTFTTDDGATFSDTGEGETFDDDEETDASPRRPAPHMRSGRMTASAAAVIAEKMTGVGGNKSLAQAAAKNAGATKKKLRSRSAGAGASLAASGSGEALTSKAQERRERRRQQSKQRDRVKGGAAAKLLGHATLPSGRLISHSPPTGPGADKANAATTATPSTASVSSLNQTMETTTPAGGNDDWDHRPMPHSHGARAGQIPLVPFGPNDGVDTSTDTLFDFMDGPNKNAPSAVDAQGCKSADDDDNGEAEGEFARSEFRKINEAAKKEWDVGTAMNSRYNPSAAAAPPGHDDGTSDASIPSALAASEVFHSNAKEAIRALLTSPPNVGGRLEDRYNNPVAADSAVDEEEKVADITAAESNTSHSSIPQVTSSGSSQMWSDKSGYVRPQKEELLKPEAEAKLDTLHERMVRPSAQLTDLINTIRRPVAVDAVTGVSKEVVLDRGYMTRRKNACGAVKVLLNKKKNRVPLCWSVGLLAALTSVLNDAGPEGAEKEYASDRMTYMAYVEARKRAVAALVSMSTAGENRVLMFHSPGLVQALGKVIREERAECRRGCCAVLAHLSRAPENRLILPKVPGIVDAMEGVLRPKILSNGEMNGRATPPPNGVRNKDKASPDRVKRLMKKWSSVQTDDDDDKSVSSRISIVRTDTDIGMSFEDEEEAVEMIMDDDDGDGGVDAGLLYDNDPNQFLHGARVYVFAALLCLLKQKANAHYLARCNDMMSTIIIIASFHSSPSHVHATTVISHLTRHSDNTKLLVSRTAGLLPVLVLAMSSPSGECRTQACRAVQNLAGERSCRQEVANAFDLLERLCACARGDASSSSKPAKSSSSDEEKKDDGNNATDDESGPATEEEERRAAVGALKNLTDEPANMIPMTNAGDCVATLMQIANGGAHGSNASGVTEEMQFMACDALATLSHWLRKIATSGVAPPAGGCGATAERPKELFRPSNQVLSWEQWA